MFFYCFWTCQHDGPVRCPQNPTKEDQHELLQCQNSKSAQVTGTPNWEFMFSSGLFFGASEDALTCEHHLLESPMLKFECPFGRVMTQLPKADLLTFWFLLFGLVLVMAPKLVGPDFLPMLPYVETRSFAAGQAFRGLDGGASWFRKVPQRLVPTFTASLFGKIWFLY